MGQGRCWQNFEQKRDINFRLVLACVRLVCGVEEGEACELRVGDDWHVEDRSGLLLSGSNLGRS